MVFNFAARSLSAPTARRLFSSSATRNTRVAVLGAGGGIGQPLSLLLKSNPLVTSLSLYDIRGAPGVAADVSHIDTASDVRNLIRIRSRSIDQHLGILRSLVMLLTSSTMPLKALKLL
jgi:lactate/malate dehydrogenase, NAD binding domain